MCGERHKDTATALSEDLPGWYWISIAAAAETANKAKGKISTQTAGDEDGDKVTKYKGNVNGNWHQRRRRWWRRRERNGNPQVRVKENKTLCKCATLAVKWNSPCPNYTWCLMSWLAIAVNWNKGEPSSPVPCLFPHPLPAQPVNFCTIVAGEGEWCPL